MQLTYRGISYNYNPPKVESAPVKLVGKYRGLDWRFHTEKHTVVQQPTVELKYRGVAYRQGQELNNRPVAERSRYLMAHRAQHSNLVQQSMLRRSVDGLAEVNV
ncbi:MAG: DUF4278 domain-containing protein [Cyanobacteria bacterium SID2]|nr:DUF4278 domain-containing protein [Cyanobacteria bacterium SID2]MBP0002605.1 DUF4278 domain-containing protein [Cyanobacteria bacterium SBC]